MTEKGAGKSGSLVLRQQQIMIAVKTQIDRVTDGGKQYRLRRYETKLLDLASRHQLDERESRLLVQLLEEHTTLVFGHTIKKVEQLLRKYNMDVQDVVALYDLRAELEKYTGTVQGLELLYEATQVIPGVALADPRPDDMVCESRDSLTAEDVVETLVEVLRDVYEVEEVTGELVFRAVKDCKALLSRQTNGSVTIIELRDYVARKSRRIFESRSGECTSLEDEPDEAQMRQQMRRDGRKRR